jgi:hypothetical protein
MGACVNAGANGAAETFGRTLQPGTYFVVVQGPAAMTGGSYTLNTTVEAAICTQANNSCKDANTASLCNERGTAFVDEVCDSGCDAATGRCNRPAGEACYNAVDVDETMTFTDTITWTTLRNDYDPGMGGCVPPTSSVVPTNGPDKTYVINVPPMSRLSAVLTDNGANSALYLLSDCSNLATGCIANANVNSFSSETLTYVNNTMAAQTVYLVADIRDIMNPTPSTVTVNVAAIICTPNQVTCSTNGAGDVGLETCNATGTAYLPFQVCSAGCDMATNQCNLAANDTCTGAVEVTPGVQIVESLTSFTASSSGACPNDNGFSFTATGRSAVYKLSGLSAGDTIRATVTSPDNRDMVVWISNSCTAGVLGSCLYGADDAGSTASPEVVEYRLTTGGDYYIVAQAYGTAVTSGAFTLDVEILTPICTPGAGTCSTSMAGDAQSVVCAPNGLEYLPAVTCASGCDVALGLCNATPGDRCDVALDLTPSMTASGNFMDFTASTMSSCPGTALFGGTTVSASGRRAVYKVSGVQAGEVIRATLNSSVDTVVWISGDCTNGVQGACLRGNDTFTTSASPEVVEYGVSTAGDYYIIAHAFGASTASGTFTVGVELLTQVCAPGTGICGTNAGGAETSQVCLPSGLGYRPAAVCAAGCDMATGLCVQSAGESCLNPVDLTPGMPFTADLSAYDSDHPITSFSSCTGDFFEGADTVFRIPNVQAGQTVTVSYTTSFDGALWITSSCAGGNAGVCLEGEDSNFSSAGGTETLVYTATSTGDLFVITGPYDSSDTSGAFTVDVAIAP